MKNITTLYANCGADYKPKCRIDQSWSRDSGLLDDKSGVSCINSECRAGKRDQRYRIFCVLDTHNVRNLISLFKVELSTFSLKMVKLKLQA